MKWVFAPPTMDPTLILKFGENIRGVQGIDSSHSYPYTHLESGNN